MESFSSELLRGSLDLMVLSVLRREPQYGYLIQQSLKQATRDRINIQAGTLYPILHRLESNKLVKAKWDTSTGRRRKWYELTRAGHRRLSQQAHDWNEYAECLRGILAPVLEAAAANPKPA
jgi:PadR family transcriptional regulator PadR